jgi:hypothetical protein
MLKILNHIKDFFNIVCVILTFLNHPSVLHSAPMLILKQTRYKINGRCRYFIDTFGIANPEILILGPDRDFYSNGWFNETGCSPCLMFAMRVYRTLKPLPLEGVWVGLIGDQRVLVHESELEPLVTLPAS